MIKNTIRKAYQLDYDQKKLFLCEAAKEFINNTMMSNVFTEEKLKIIKRNSMNFVKTVNKNRTVEN